MKITLSIAAPFVLVLALVALAVAVASPATAEGKRYVCAPCGLPCDSEVFDKPGSCPKCGMALVEQDAATAEAAARKKVGILIFNGVQIIDYTGPYEIFQGAGLDVYTIAETKEPISTVAGMTVVPKYTFANAPPPDILVVPGGGIGGAMASATTVKFVRETTAHTQHTMSVCNGAFILAKAGLLDGLTATTTHGNIAKLRAEYPKTKVVDDQRFVDNGKIITTGGLTAGIDGALHVVSLMFGKGIAQAVALGEEYDWHPDGGFVRGILADTNLMPWLDDALDGTGTWDVAKTEGGTDHWEIEGKGTSKLSAAELMDHVAKTLSTEGKWTAVKDPDAASTPGATTRWAFTGRDGKPWTGILAVKEASAGPGTYLVKLKIARVS